MVRGSSHRDARLDHAGDRVNGRPGTPLAVASDIEDLNQLAGRGENIPGESYALVWTPHAITDLGTLSGSYGEARRIDDQQRGS